MDGYVLFSEVDGNFSSDIDNEFIHEKL